MSFLIASEDRLSALSECCSVPFCSNLNTRLLCNFYVPCCRYQDGMCVATTVAAAANASDTVVDTCPVEEVYIQPLARAAIALVLTALPFVVWWYIMSHCIFRPVKKFVSPEYKSAATKRISLDEALSAHRADEVDMQSVQDDASTQLLGVSLALVIEALDAGAPASAILDELYQGSRFLRRFNPQHQRMSIISYRCIKAESDCWTLDESAFLSAVESARTFTIDYLWLDSWAYRKSPYVHADFCKTLAYVMLTTTHVVWLPRSRKTAPGAYQYRLWCTFEASMVALRTDLTVSIAGYVPSPTQWHLLRWGAGLMISPSTLWARSGRSADRVKVRLLGILNLLLYLTVWMWLFFLVMRDQLEGGLSVMDVVMELIWVLAWLMIRSFGCDGLRKTVRMAHNGCEVLRMLHHAARHSAKGRDRPALAEEYIEKVLKNLQSELAWLPAFDRRDVMTVKAVINAYSIMHITALYPDVAVRSAQRASVRVSHASEDDDSDGDSDGSGGDDSPPPLPSPPPSPPSPNVVVVGAHLRGVARGAVEVISSAAVEVVEDDEQGDIESAGAARSAPVSQAAEATDPGKLALVADIESAGAARSAPAKATSFAALPEQPTQGRSDTHVARASFFADLQIEAEDSDRVEWVRETPKDRTLSTTPGGRQIDDTRNDDGSLVAFTKKFRGLSGDLTIIRDLSQKLSSAKELAVEGTVVHDGKLIDTGAWRKKKLNRVRKTVVGAFRRERTPSVDSRKSEEAAEKVLKADADNDALMLSIYTAAQMQRQDAYDKPKADQSPKTWLEDAGIQTSEGATKTDASAAPRRSERWSKEDVAMRTVSRGTRHSHTVVDAVGIVSVSRDDKEGATGTWFTEPSECRTPKEGKRAQIRRERRKKRKMLIKRVRQRGFIDAESELTVDDLYHLSWQLVRGVTCLVEVPGASYFVDAPVRVPPKASSIDRRVHWAWDLRHRRTQAPRIKHHRIAFAMLFFTQVAITYGLRGLAIAVKLQWPEVSAAWTFYRTVRVWMVPLGTAASLAYLLLAVQLRQIVGFARAGAFPLPLRFAFKLEAAFLWAAVGYQLASIGGVFSMKTSNENLPNLMSGLVGLAVCGIEVVLALSSGIVSAVRDRDVRLLFQTTSSRLERRTSFVI